MTDERLKRLAEMVFLSEIVKQIKIAKRSAERLQSTNDDFDDLEVWCSIQSILIAAGNVSKILWPSRKSSQERGERLRDLLGIDKGNLLEDRKIRNHFEHYDERIEDWFKKNKSAVYIDSKIDSLEPRFLGINQFSHRKYNPLTKTLTFRDELLDLGKLVSDLEMIRIECSKYGLQ